MVTVEKKVIHKEMIFLGQKVSRKQDVLDLLVTKANEIGLISKTITFLEAVQKRELEASTAVGYQVAIPHGQSQVVTQPFIGFVQVSDEFNWNKEDNEPIKLVFLIGIPENNEDNIHLKFISQLSRKLLDASFRNKLLEVQDSNEAYQLLSLINE